MEPKHGLTGSGYGSRANGEVESIDDVQMFFYTDGHISGSFVCRTAESTGILWLFKDGWLAENLLRFAMVHIELRFPRDPIAQFVGDYDGEGTYSGSWSSPSETGRWQIALRDIVRPHTPSADWTS